MDSGSRNVPKHHKLGRLQLLLPVGSGVVGGIVGDHGADGDGVDGVRLLLEHTAAQRGQHPQQVLHAAPGSVDIIYIYVDCRYIYIQ